MPLLTERERIDMALEPEVRGADTYTTTYYAMRDYGKLRMDLLVGTVTANGTADFKLRQAKTAAGGSVKDITGKAITQLTDADDDKIVAIELDSSELDVNNGFAFVCGTLVTAVANVACAVVVHRSQGAYQPVGTAQFDEVIA